ncbi:MAG: glycosyltransferase family 1 protein [Gammaproteobacteria bacterium]
MNARLRVGLDVTQAVKRRGRGIARYIGQVLPPLLREPGVEAELFIRGHRWFQRRLIAELAADRPRHWLLGAGRLDGDGLDLFHSFGNHLPARAAVPLSFTVHDVRALDRPAGYEGRERLQRNLQRAAGVICLTRYGRDRLLHHHPELADRELAVVPHGVDHRQFRPQALERADGVLRRYGLRPPYLVQLGSWFPHKNLELSIEAFARSRARNEGFRLAFVGGGAPANYRRRLERLAQSFGVGGAVDWVEHVPGEDLAPLLAAARCLLQPSRYEGFALPLLEAMAVALPGVVSDSSCLPEVSGGVWPVAGVDDAEAFAAGLDLMALDETARSEAIRRGLEHAADFTWEHTAAKTTAFFRAVAASG